MGKFKRLKRRQKRASRRKGRNKIPLPEPKIPLPEPKLPLPKPKTKEEEEEFESQEVEEQTTCIELTHDKQQIFQSPAMVVESPSLIIKDLLRVAEKFGIPQFFMDPVTQFMIPPPLSFPTTQCVWIPHSPHANILRIVAHPIDDYEKAPSQLVISSQKIEIDYHNKQTCQQICAGQEPEQCLCVSPKENMSFLDMEPSAEFGKNVIYVTDHVEGGQKYLTTVDGNVGFQVISMFSNVVYHGVPDKNRINLMVMPDRSADDNADLMYVGGKSLKNVLLTHLNTNVNKPCKPEDFQMSDLVQPKLPWQRGHNHRNKRRLKRRYLRHQMMSENDRKKFGNPNEIPLFGKPDEIPLFGHPNEMPPMPEPESCKVNVIIQLNQNEELLGKEQLDVWVEAIPLSSDGEIQKVNINQMSEKQSSIYVGCGEDYDLRIENLGSTPAEFDIFTVDVPTNCWDTSNYAYDPVYMYDAFEAPEKPRREASSESMEGMERFIRVQSTKQVHFKQELPIIMGVIAAIMIFMSFAVVCLFDMKGRRRQNRRRRQQQQNEENNSAGAAAPIEEVYDGKYRNFGDAMYSKLESPNKELTFSEQQALSYQVFSVPKHTTIELSN